MDVPISGIILAPFSLAFFVFAPSRLSELAVFITIFQAASIINLGSFGLTPYFFVVMLIALRLVPKWWSGQVCFDRNDPALLHMRTMALFVGWAVMSAFVLPVLFAGTPVDDPRMGVDRSFFNQMPLHWSFSNAGQAAYMALNFIMVLEMLQMSRRPGYTDRLQRVFSWSGLCVVAIGAYQVLGGRVGLKFPSWLFNSNVGWGQAYNQAFNGILRLSASFVEPSEAAGFLSAWALFELTLVIRGTKNNGWHWLCVVAGTIALAETASTTGYITVAVMWTVIFLMIVKGALTRGRVNVRALLAIMIMLSGAAAALLTMPSAAQILTGVLLGKSHSASAAHRTATLGRAIDVFYNTLTLGAGLGSNRAMSLFFYVLSNLGLPGIILLSILLYQLWTQYSYCRNRFKPTLVMAAGVAFAANLLTLLFAGAEVSVPRLWILWGMLLAGTRGAWLAEHPGETEWPAGTERAVSAVRRGAYGRRRYQAAGGF